MSERIENHRSVRYELKEYRPGEASFVITRRDDGRRFEVTGICPGCRARVVTSWTFGVGAPKGPFSRQPAAPPDPGPRTLCCDCGHAHSNRPGDAVFLGCGAYWQVEFRP